MVEWWKGECERTKGRKHEKEEGQSYSTTPILQYSTIGDRRQEKKEECWNNGMGNAKGRKGENTKGARS